MPREAAPEDLEQSFPWKEWATRLNESPTGALFFGPDDFGAISPYVFKRRAKKALTHMDVTVRVRGEEVLVSLNA